mgnify:FL=1|jgi:hypothetical protein
MNNSKKYNWGDLIVTVDYAKGFDYTDVVKEVVKSANIRHEQTVTNNLPIVVTFKDKWFNNDKKDIRN